MVDTEYVSAEQTELWEEFKKMRNKINNRTRQEETNFQRSKVQECQDSLSKSWGTAKKYIGWSSPGKGIGLAKIITWIIQSIILIIHFLNLELGRSV